MSFDTLRTHSRLIPASLSLYTPQRRLQPPNLSVNNVEGSLTARTMISQVSGVMGVRADSPGCLGLKPLGPGARYTARRRMPWRMKKIRVMILLLRLVKSRSTLTQHRTRPNGQSYPSLRLRAHTLLARCESRRMRIAVWSRSIRTIEDQREIFRSPKASNFTSYTEHDFYTNGQWAWQR